MNTARAIAAAVNGGAPARAAVEISLARAEADTHNAIIRIHRERALNAADAVQARVKAGEFLPLAGVPIVVKDNISVRGMPATACSKILTGYVAPFNATAVERLEAAGAVVVATSNMDEFAMGSSNETSVFGPVRNPVDPTRIPGGSSGGSAAAVVAGIAPIALGSDTGGSIRQPASLCGCVGLKPTYGMVSRHGLIAFGSSLDQIGPLTTTVDDAALCLDIMAGTDIHDSTSAPRQHVALAPMLAGDPIAAIKGLRVGFVPEHREGLQPEVRARLDSTLESLRKAGAELVEVHVPHERYAIAVYYIVATGEAASNLARFDGVRFGHREDADSLHGMYAKTRASGFGTEVKRRIMLGTHVLSSGYYDAYYKKAMAVRRRLCDDFSAAFTKCDVLLGPTSPTTAFKVGEKTADPLTMYLSDIFTIAANLVGIPGISVPAGSDNQGLPIGLQLQAAQWGEAALLRAAAGIAALGR